MSSGRRLVMIGLAAVVLWYLCTLVFWAVQSFTDHVPVGVDYTRKNPQEISVRVECNAPFRAASRGHSPLPTLTPQPSGQPPLAFAYDPCARIHREARVLLVLDTVVALGGIALAVWLVVWRFGLSTVRAALLRR